MKKKMVEGMNAQQAMEEAAKICDEEMMHYERLEQAARLEFDGETGAVQWDAYVTAAKDCAATIRERAKEL